MSPSYSHDYRTDRPTGFQRLPLENYKFPSTFVGITPFIFFMRGIFPTEIK